MNDNKVVEISVAHAKSLNPNECYIDDDIILFEDFAKIPLPAESARMNCLFVALCTEGKAGYTVDTKERTIAKNDVIIVSEGQVVGDYMLSRDCTGIAIMMSYDFFRETISDIHELSQLFLFSRTHPVFRLDESEVDIIKEYFSLIKRKANETGHHFRKELVCTLIKSLIYDMSNVIYRIQMQGTRKQTRAESIFTSFIKLVEQNFRVERRVGWYAEQMCITPKYLSETVKAVSKRRPNEWIDNYVMSELCVLLKNSSMSIKDITLAMHFPNQSFLGKFFKEHMGVSPKEWRKG